jgi:glycosyltransferase involved in cell wall biosynthesis
MLFAAFLRADVVHVTGDIQYCTILLRRKRSLLTVHDLTSVRRLAGWRRLALTWIWYRIPCRRARRITTISGSTLQELLELSPQIGTKCSVVPNPVGQEFLGGGEQHEFGNPPVVLLVGTAANKNLELTVEALTGLDVSLRIVGPLSEEQRSVLETSGLPYQSEQDLSDDELVQAYSESDVLVFASLYEGFGLPIIEAQAVGVPVVTSNTFSMPEVAGPGAILVDPHHTSEIRNAVVALLGTPALRQELIESGRLNLERFSPESIAAQYAALYREYRR